MAVTESGQPCSRLKYAWFSFPAQQVYKAVKRGSSADLKRRPLIRLWFLPRLLKVDT